MKNEVYQIITDRIIALLEKGTVPWQKPWNSTMESPRNLISGKHYRGVNVFLLHAMNYSSPYWLTYKQAVSLGGNVKRGEKACPIVFWKRLMVEDENAKNGKKFIPFLRYYSGFNVAQCEGIPAEKIPALAGNVREHTPIVTAENVVKTMPKCPAINYHGQRACYSPAFDTVDMPEASTFCGGEEFYSTLFHELTHATGHESRLNRKGIAGTDGQWNAFGTPSYAREELVAEMGAAFLAGHCGIVERTVDNSANYIGAWLSKLKEDNKLVVVAAAQAQRAADFILNVQHEQTESENE